MSIGTIEQRSFLRWRSRDYMRLLGAVRSQPGLALASAYLSMLVAIAIFAPLVSPYDPIAQDLNNAISPPSLSHWLGTDSLGRDVLSRLMWGARPALIGVFIAVFTSCFIGVPWGLISGYAGGLLDLGLMRLADAFLIFPGIVLALVFTTVLGPSLESTMVALGIVYSPILARVVRSGVMRVANREYVIITRLYGVSPIYRMIHHVLPNALAPTLVQITLLFGMSLLAQTGLSYLGLGVQPPYPSWGGSLAESFQYIVIYPMATIIPGTIVIITVMSIYRIGDALRDRLDVK
jgi:peptide/nickel transport system permease protein